MNETANIVSTGLYSGYAQRSNPVWQAHDSAQMPGYPLHYYYSLKDSNIILLLLCCRFKKWLAGCEKIWHRYQINHQLGKVIMAQKKSWHQHMRVAPKRERTGPDGFVYDSKTEYRRWCYLRQCEMAGEIRDLQRQVKHTLHCCCGVEGCNVKIMAGKRSAVYTADFTYWVDLPGKGYQSKKIIEDVKGYRDEGSKFRIRVFEALYSCKVNIVKLKNNRWVTE